MKNIYKGLLLSILAVMLGGCAATISGTVKFADQGQGAAAEQGSQGSGEEQGQLEGIVVNMINTTADVTAASYSVKTDKGGKFKADPAQLKPGTYKVEINEPGYRPESKTIEFKDSSREVDFELKRMPMGSSRSYRGSQSDRDKIINPGEVNIQPPSM
jgi:hypothetical protein